MAQACPLPRTLLLMFEGGGLVRPALLPAAGAAASAGLSLGAAIIAFLGPTTMSMSGPATLIRPDPMHYLMAICIKMMTQMMVMMIIMSMTTIGRFLAVDRFSAGQELTLSSCTCLRQLR